MRSVCLFVLYLYACTCIVLRSITRRGNEVYRRHVHKECPHIWVEEGLVARKRSGIYARCSRCQAAR